MYIGNERIEDVEMIQAEEVNDVVALVGAMVNQEEIDNQDREVKSTFWLSMFNNLDKRLFVEPF